MTSSTIRSGCQLSSSRKVLSRRRRKARLKAAARQVVLDQRRQFRLVFNDRYFPGHSGRLSRRAFGAGTDVAQMIERINARLVAVVPVDTERVIAHRLDAVHLQLRLEHLKRIAQARGDLAGLLPRLGSMRAGAARAGAPVAQIFDRRTSCDGRLSSRSRCPSIWRSRCVRGRSLIVRHVIG